MSPQLKQLNEQCFVMITQFFVDLGEAGGHVM